MKKIKVIFVSILVALVGITAFNTSTIINANTTVTNQSELQNAINANESNIILGSDISLTSVIVIPSTYSGKIEGSGNQIVANFRGNMFSVTGDVNSDVVRFSNVTLNGNNQARAIWATSQANIRLESGTKIVNGKADESNPNGGGIYLSDSSLLMDGASSIVSCISKETGGAIYAYDSSVTIQKQSLLENNISTTSGGAIAVSEGSSLSVNNSTFTNNKCTGLGAESNGATIFCEIGAQSLSVSESTFNVSGPFNVGGAIYCLGVDTVNVENSNFNINSVGDAYSVGGGAILLSGVKKATMNNITCTASGAVSKATYAGGFIDIVGEVNLDIANSTFTSTTGTLSTFGGGICFENGSSGTTTISNSHFTGLSADQSGGAISVATNATGSASVNLTIKDSTFENCSTWTWGVYAGGAIMNGTGNTLVLDNVSISGCKSPNGGAIYNAGNLEVKNSSVISSNTAQKYGGAIYNKGTATISSTSFEGNIANGNKNVENEAEYAGSNVYCEKDVTIYGNSTFDDGDVRVLDAQSSILAPTALNNVINVSISETAKTKETDSRYVGYSVVKGTNGYTLTNADLKKVVYKSRDTDASQDSINNK